MKISSNQNTKPQTGSLFYQYLATITGNIIIICTGMHFAWPSQSLPQLLEPESHIPITDDDGSWIASMPGIGAMAGALMAAYVVDIIGRKTCLMIASPCHLLAWILVAFSQSLPMLYCARFLAGIADGIVFTALPMYLGEIADPRIRGMICSSIPVVTIVGYFLINLMGTYLDLTTTALIASGVPILHFITFYFMPESFYYLVMRNKHEKATKSLQTFKGLDDVNSDLSKIVLAVNTDLKNSGKIWDLFTVSNNRKAMIIAAGLRGFQQLSGTSIITFYADTIFEETNNYLPASIITNIYFLTQIISSIICSVLVDRVGRKPLMIFSITGSALTLALKAIYFYFDASPDTDVSDLDFIPIIALMGFVIIFNLGMGTIPMLMLGELFSTNIKAVALCLADIYFSVLVTILSKFFQITKDCYGIHVPFCAFSISAISGLLFIIFYVPETKGKTLEEIQEGFEKKKCSNDPI